MTKEKLVSEALFQSPEAFEHAFVAGLSELLEQSSLGEFILVLANATLSHRWFNVLQTRLSGTFDALSSDLQADFRGGHVKAVVEDDLMVFLKLHLSGLSHLNLVRHRLVGDWQVQFNHLRVFRPQRMTCQAAPPMQMPFDEQAFHFDKAFLRKECLWEGDLHGMPMSVYYNKYPFTDFHCLLIPDKSKHHPQYLTAAYHAYLWQLGEALGGTFPHIKFGYNALGAYASVNHFHVQMALKATPFPVEQAQWQHQGGTQIYPIETQVFTHADAAWAFIHECQQQQQPFNLLYTPGRLFAWARKAQGTYAQPDWTAGFTWFELAGSFITFNAAHFDALEDQQVRDALFAAYR